MNPLTFTALKGGKTKPSGHCVDSTPVPQLRLPGGTRCLDQHLHGFIQPQGVCLLFHGMLRHQLGTLLPTSPSALLMTCHQDADGKGEMILPHRPDQQKLKWTVT